MERIKITLFTLLLTGCSAGTINCNSEPCAAINGALMIKDIYSQESSHKCDEMFGERKTKCLQQVEDLKQSLNKHSKK